jgi:hypothetical protein
MFSLGRLATGLISSSGETAPVDAPSGSARSEADGDDDPPSSSRSRPSAACPASPILRRSKELGSSSSSSSNSSSSPGGPCLAAVGGGSLGNLPRSLPPSASAVGLKGLPLQLISTALSVGPTLLPPHLANLISALALSMRVSLRATAFFVEAILESCKYGTAAGLGLTRRALIAAVSSARTVYAVREGMDWAGDKLGSLKGNDAFLSVLDRVRPEPARGGRRRPVEANPSRPPNVLRSIRTSASTSSPTPLPSPSSLRCAAIAYPNSSLIGRIPEPKVAAGRCLAST